MILGLKTALILTGNTFKAAWKLSQNHSEGDRKGVIENLEKAGDDDARIIAGMMRKMMEK